MPNITQPRAWRALLTLGLAAACTLAASTPASAAPPPKDERGKGGPSRFVKIATHPEAAAQPTETGRTIATLKAFEGKFYAGFGDYGANTGPIAIDPFGAAGFQAAPVINADTEAIYSYREIAGRLYAPSIDPRRGSTFAAGGADLSSWQTPTAFVADHVFDAVTLDGEDVWLVGSQGTDAVAWRSLDAGSTWTEMLRVGPETTDFARFYAAGVLNGRLYVQATDFAGGVHPRTMVFNGTGWSEGPSLGSVFTHTEEFDGRLLFHRAYHSGVGQGPLSAFDGTASVTAHDSVYDYTIADGRVYVLGADGKVMSSDDLTTWQQVGRAPRAARSIGVLNGVVYLGGTDAEIYRQP